jgi:hypothetical protein
VSGNPGAAAIEGPLRALEQRVWLLGVRRDVVRHELDAMTRARLAEIDDEITEANRELNDMLDARRAMFSADITVRRKR